MELGKAKEHTIQKLPSSICIYDKKLAKCHKFSHLNGLTNFTTISHKLTSKGTFGGKG